MKILSYMRVDNWIYAIIGFALLTGLALSVVSYLELCSEECKAGQDWKLFGLPFAPIGILYFSALSTLHLLSWKKPSLGLGVSYGLAGALGAEVVLILIQKYKIGHWCPVCLGIAASVLVAALAKGAQCHLQKGEFMRKVFTPIAVFIVGFLTLFVGIAKENKLDAMENSIKEQIAMGKLDAPISLYLFTDWACPACRALEPRLMKLMPALESKARVTFVDVPVHPETLNYSPYNLSFMIHNKNQYLALRDALSALSIDTKTPKDEQIENLAKEQGTTYKPLNYSDIDLALKYWKGLATQFDIEGTPIMVIVNPKAKKGKKLSGLEEITEANILKAISTLTN